jgi:hypothetical protein
MHRFIRIACDSASITSIVSKWLSAVKCYSGTRNWLFRLSRRIHFEQLAWCQRKWRALIFICLAFFGLCEFGLSVYGSCFFLERFSNHGQGHRQTSSEICTTFDAVSLSGPSWNRIRPDILLQIKRRKNQHFHPAASRCYNCCTDAAPVPEIMDNPSTILSFDITCSWVVNFTSLPLYPQDRVPYRFDRSLGAPRTGVNYVGKRNSFALTENSTLVVQPVCKSAYRLSYNISQLLFTSFEFW